MTLNKTGAGMIGLLRRQMRFDLREGFLLLTTKKVPLKSMITELIGLIRGIGY